MTGWLFLGHGPWQPHSAIVRHRRIWKGLASDFDTSLFEVGAEIVVERAAGIRYVALAGVGAGGCAEAIAVCRSFQFGCLFIGPPTGIPPLTAESIFSAAFPMMSNDLPETSIDWPSLTSFLCSRGCIVLRETIEAADGRVMLDFFMAEQLLQGFHPTVENVGDLSSG